MSRLQKVREWTEECSERGECTCGKEKGHVGWAACLEEAVQESDLTGDPTEGGEGSE